MPELHEECEAGGGPITDFYVNGLLKIAALAIPAINEVEAATDRDARIESGCNAGDRPS